MPSAIRAAREAEAFNRLIAMAALIDQPIMIFHVSTAEGAAAVRRARGDGLKVFAETCPQYLFMTAQDLDRPGLEGAKWMCSPPPRAEADQEALWRALALGDLQTVSSDHAPYAFDETGKLRAGPSPNFKQIANGMPGLECAPAAAVRRHGLEGPARGREIRRAHRDGAGQDLQPHQGKGSLAIGADADVAIWDPQKRRSRSPTLRSTTAPATRPMPAAPCRAGR